MFGQFIKAYSKFVINFIKFNNQIIKDKLNQKKLKSKNK